MVNPVWYVFGISFTCVVLIWATLRYAESSTVQRPWIDVAPKILPRVIKPIGNYVLCSGNYSDKEYWVVASSDKWRNTRAADSCARAEKEHEFLVKKFLDLPVAQRTKRVPNAMNLAETQRTVLWSQKDKDINYQVADDETIFAYVSAYETDHRNAVLGTISDILGDPVIIRPQLESLYGA